QRVARNEFVAAPLVAIVEIEPNDTVGQAQPITLGTAAGKDPDVTISGAMGSASDVDVFKATLKKGDIVGLACHVTGSADSMAGVFDSGGTVIFFNDDNGGLDAAYPPNSPWPVATSARDSALTFIAPQDGDFLFAVKPFDAGSIGNYQLELRARRPFIETQL